MKRFFIILIVLSWNSNDVFSGISNADLIQAKRKLRNNHQFMKSEIFFPIHQVILQLKYQENNDRILLRKTKIVERYYYEKNNLAINYKNVAATIHIKKQFVILDDILKNINAYVYKEGSLPEIYYNPRLLALIKTISKIATMESKKEDEEMFIYKEKKDDFLLCIKENYFDDVFE